jgi:hypothetical protein
MRLFGSTAGHRFARSRDSTFVFPQAHSVHLLLRGLILLLVIAVALFAALRAFTKSGESPAACGGDSQACVTTNDALPGGWPSNPNRP